jgi:hypothetical protein
MLNTAQFNLNISFLLLRINDCAMPVRRPKQICNVSYERFSAGEYAVPYTAWSKHDWSSLHNETSVDAAVTQATDFAAASGRIKRHKYPAWFSSKSKAYLKYLYRRYTNLKTLSRANFIFTGN